MGVGLETVVGTTPKFFTLSDDESVDDSTKSVTSDWEPGLSPGVAMSTEQSPQGVKENASPLRVDGIPKHSISNVPTPLRGLMREEQQCLVLHNRQMTPEFIDFCSTQRFR